MVFDCEKSTISQISDRLFIGNYESLRDEIIKNHNIDAIVLASTGLEPGNLAKKCSFVNLAMTEEQGENIGPKLIKGAQFINHKLKGQKNVLVTCFFGMNRSVSVVITYLMLYRNLSYDDAYALVKLKRPMASPINSYIEGIKKCVDHVRSTRCDLTKNSVPEESDSLTSRIIG